ncbi:MAG: GPW/gp25 family protein [Pseudomonadota bacterium]
MESTQGSKRFLGTGWSFPPAFERRMHAGGGMDGSRGIGAALVSAEIDIEQSLRILLATNPGERVMQPAYGCGIKRMVFEQLNESLLTEMRHMVEKAILFFEPRITVEDISIDAGRWEDGELRIHVAYTVRTTNSRYNMVFPMYFREGTGLGVVET